MRIAIVGLGGVGVHHLRIMSAMDEFEVVAACDTNEDLLQERTKGRSIACYADAAALLATERLDAVSLCTPPKAHPPHTRWAAERGVHVLCEKPMAPTPELCQQMIDDCTRHHVVLMVAHKKRFVAAVQRLKHLCDTDLGPIQVLYHRYPHPWMSEADWFWAEDDGGGPLVENAVHAADCLHFLMGDVERVYAEGDVFNAPHRAPQLNCAVYTARFQSGAMAMVGAGMIGTPAPGLMFEDFYAACVNGTAQVAGGFDNPTELKYAFRNKPTELHVEEFEGEDPFVAEFRHFSDCVATGRTPISSGPESKKAITLCHAVKASARTRTPVEIEPV